MTKNEKNSNISVEGFGGPERIRTAVEGFADLCLAARPQDLFLVGANIEKNCINP